MVGLKSVARVLVPLVVVCGALFAASCGGSGSSTPSTAATNGPAAYGVSLGDVNEQIPLPAVSDGISVSLNYVGPTSPPSASPSPTPFPTGGVTLNTTTTPGVVPSAPALQSRGRVPLSKTNATVVLSVQFSLSTPLPATIFPSETLTFGTSTPQNVPYFVEIDDMTNNTYVNTYPGNAFANGQVLFNNSGGYIAGSNLPGGQYSTDQYLMQFYYLGVGASPTPSPSPSPAPTGSATAQPQPSASPVVVATTVPLTAGSVVLPVTLGGFVGTVQIPGTVANTTLNLSAQSALPPGIPSVGSGNVYFPFYSVVFSASAAVNAISPGITLQLPSTFTNVSQIEAIGCVSPADCASPAAGNIQNTTMGTQNGAPTAVLAPGAFSGFTGYTTSPEYVIFAANRTNQGATTTVAIPANGSATANVPGATFPNGGGLVPSTVTLGTASVATTATINAQAGLLSTITAIIPNSQTIFYSLGITASPAVTIAGNSLACGASCIRITLPSQVLTAVAGTSGYYVEQCTATACPAPSTSPQPLTLNGNTLTVSSAQIGSISGLGSTPVFLVFYAM
jgi:hypothetical protein